MVTIVICIFVSLIAIVGCTYIAYQDKKELKEQH